MKQYSNCFAPTRSLLYILFATWKLKFCLYCCSILSETMRAATSLPLPCWQAGINYSFSWSLPCAILFLKY